MALRVLLVAMVAALGLEVPSGDELEAWGRSGRAWVAARVADLSSLGGEAGPTPASLPASVTAGQLAAANEASSRDDLAFEAAVEAMASGFSGDLAASATAHAIVAAGPAAPAAPEAESAPAPGSRLEKLSTAVRLTKQAVDAWASLIQPEAEEGRGDSL